MPWSNVLANPEFGTILTASGAAYTWSGNSRENRLTPFANDPITDPTGEAIFIRDEHDRGGVAHAWPVAPVQPIAVDGSCGTAPALRIFNTRSMDSSRISPSVSRPTIRSSFSLLTLTNTSAETRQLSVFGYVEWVLGAEREHTRHQLLRGSTRARVPSWRRTSRA